jgi:carbamoyltransferase
LALKRSVFLGLSFGHGDSSAALIVDGTLVAAAEEERFSRVKHDARFPQHAIQYCLRHAGITGKEVSAVAIAKKPGHWFRKLRLAIAHPKLLEKKPSELPISLGKELKKLGITRARRYRFDHHLAHLMSARYLSGDDSIGLMSLDGLGDFVSATIGRPQGHSIEILDRVFFPHSLGYFYTALTQ